MNLYTVVSEFRFDIAGAVLGTDTLQKKVEGLSASVDNAIQSVKASGLSMIMSLTGAQAGVMGLIQSSLGASSKFTSAQLSFVQIMDANAGHFTGTIETLNDKMLVSSKILKDIAKDAMTYGLSTDELYEQTKGIGAMLAPKGLTGDNFGTAREMGRNLLKAAPILGVESGEVQGQMMRSIGGQASMGDTLFRRLAAEAPEIFKKFNIGDKDPTKMFNALDISKRVQVLNQAMGKFTQNLDILKMRAGTLNGMMQILKDTFMGINSVLKPLGDILMPVIQKIFTGAITWINTKGRDTIKVFAAYLNKFFIDEPEKMFVDVMQARNLSRDVGRSAGIVGTIVGLLHLREILGALSKVPIISKIAMPLHNLFEAFLRIPILGKAITSLMSIFQMGHMTSFSALLKGVFVTMTRMAGMLGILLIPLQGFTRAIARADVELLQWFAENSVKIAEVLGKMADALYVLFTPIQDLIKGFEELFFHAFVGGTKTITGTLSALDALANGMKFFADSILYWWSGIRAFVDGVSSLFYTLFENIYMIIQNVLSGNFKDVLFGTENVLDNVMTSMIEEFDRSFSRAQTPLTDGNADGHNVSSLVVNQSIQMNNSFKEVLQPDRIAFTIKDQLEKTALNRTKSRSNSIAGMNAKAVM